MTITQKDIERLTEKADNAWRRWAQAANDPKAEPVFVHNLKYQADLAQRELEQAWKVLLGKTTKQVAK